MDHAISNLLKTIPVFTTNTDTYHNDKVHSYIGSANYAMGQKCGLAVLYPDNVDVIAGREPPPAVDVPLTFRVYWDASDMLNEGLRQRLFGLNETLTGQGAALEIFLPTGNPDCPCLADYPDGAVLEDNGQIRVGINGLGEFDYPVGYGVGTCSQHDRHLAPSCDGINPPSWCSNNWCYVDPDNCKAGLEGTNEGGYIWSRTPDLEIPPYSYETCGFANTYLDGNAARACLPASPLSDAHWPNPLLSCPPPQEQTWNSNAIATIVLSSNWAQRFMPSVFICGEEAVQMPTVPQYGQSPFVQGLTAVSMAITAGHMDSAQRFQWKANIGNAVASNSVEMYDSGGAPGEWGSYFSEEEKRSKDQYGAITGAGCWGQYCDYTRLKFFKQIQTDAYKIYETKRIGDYGVQELWKWDEHFNNYGSEVTCPRDYVVTQVACHYTFCSTMSLRCNKLKPPWVWQDADIYHTWELSEENSGWIRSERSCNRPGSVVVGMRCGANACDNKRLVCHGINGRKNVDVSGEWKVFGLGTKPTLNFKSSVQNTKQVDEMFSTTNTFGFASEVTASGVIKLVDVSAKMSVNYERSTLSSASRMHNEQKGETYELDCPSPLGTPTCPYSYDSEKTLKAWYYLVTAKPKWSTGTLFSGVPECNVICTLYDARPMCPPAACGNVRCSCCSSPAPYEGAPICSSLPSLPSTAPTGCSQYGAGAVWCQACKDNGGGAGCINTVDHVTTGCFYPHLGDTC